MVHGAVIIICAEYVSVASKGFGQQTIIDLSPAELIPQNMVKIDAVYENRGFVRHYTLSKRKLERPLKRRHPNLLRILTWCAPQGRTPGIILRFSVNSCILVV